MTGLRILLALGTAFLVAACATPQALAPDAAPEYVIVQQFSPFYRVSPMQVRGPDASLPAQTRVKQLRQEMGYSLIQLEDGRTGYVANENMAVAPPRPPPPRDSLASADGPSSKPGNRKRGSSGARYTGEQLNDVPLPDANVPPPDLNIGPEEIPAATSTPTPPPEKPKFRF